MFYVVAFVGHLRSRIFPWKIATHSRRSTQPLKERTPTHVLRQDVVGGFWNETLHRYELVTFEAGRKNEKVMFGKKYSKKSYVDFVERKAQI